MCDAHYQRQRLGQPLDTPIRPRRAKATVVVDPRAAEMWRLFAEEELNFDQIGGRYGVTRERVRQLVTETYGKGLIALARRRHAARRRMREYVETNPGQQPPCAVCGVALTSKHWRTAKWNLCADHERFRGAVMLMCDEERNAKHKALVRRAHGRDVPTYDGEIWSKRKKRRWLNPNSQMHVLCTEAYDNCWPLLERLPEEILDQLHQEALAS